MQRNDKTILWNWNGDYKEIKCFEKFLFRDIKMSNKYYIIFSIFLNPVYWNIKGIIFEFQDVKYWDIYLKNKKIRILKLQAIRISRYSNVLNI